MTAHEDMTRLAPGLGISIFERNSDGRSAVLRGLTKTDDCNGEDKSGKIGGK
jgi:hypothetical protein